jgi:hypothetical protein
MLRLMLVLRWSSLYSHDDAAAACTYCTQGRLALLLLVLLLV